MWIFGYGSLIWKVDFPYEEKVIGYIKGYTRKFWQASIDHRGVPEKPGRVVTLVKSDNCNAKVWGIAYLVNEHFIKNESNLMMREKRYTNQAFLMVFGQCDSLVTEKALVYVGTDDPTLYLGPCSLNVMAQQIATAHGPSGHNFEYLFELAEFLRNINCQEEKEIFVLEQLVKEILKKGF